MLRRVYRFCYVTTALLLLMYFAQKDNTNTMEPDSMKGEKQQIRKSKLKFISSEKAKRQYPVPVNTIDDKEVERMPSQLHKDKNTRRRLLSNENEPVKQDNNSLLIKDPSTIAKTYQFPDDIQEMCPFADICHIMAKEEIQQPFTSCCRSCYCDEHCGQRGDCCFTADGVHSPDTENTTGCIKTAIQGWGGPILSVVKEYHVIDSCLSSEQTCKEKTSAPWGALFPGYSPKTDSIYYNSHCAACNNKDDFQLWNFYIMSDALDISNEVLLDALQGNRYPIVFIPPNNDDVKKHECFKSAIKACNVTGEWQEYDRDIEEACHRFQAPVSIRRGSVTFSNIYCLVCNGKSDAYVEKCITHPLYSRGGAGIALSGLLDFATISQTSSAITSASSGKDCPKHTVHYPHKDECRPILCPFGFTMTPLDCQIYMREWNKNGYIQMIELLPEQEGLLIPVTAFDTLTENERKNPKLWINTQGLPMDTFNFYGQLRRNASSVSKIVLQIGGNQFPLKMEKILSKVERALSKMWTMKLNGYTYRFTAKHYRFRVSIETDGYKEMDVGTHKGKVRFNNAYIIISKMNFCRQVQLYDDEYGFPNDRSAMQLNLRGDGTGKTLGDGEFLSDSVEFRLKVCIEDFLNEIQPARSNYIQCSPFTTASMVVIGWFLL